MVTSIKNNQNLMNAPKLYFRGWGLSDIVKKTTIILLSPVKWLLFERNQLTGLT
jgi:hypothetical protein